MNVYRIDSRVSRDPCKHRIKVSRAAVRVFSLRGARSPTMARNGLCSTRLPPTRPRSTGMERKETVSAMNTNRSERIRRAPLRASYRPFIVLRDMRLTSNLLFLVGFDLHGGRFDGERQVFLFLFSKSRNETSSSLLLLDFEIL